MKQIIFHIDVNNAFLSWSAVKLLKEGYKQITLLGQNVNSYGKDKCHNNTADNYNLFPVGIDAV